MTSVDFLGIYNEVSSWIFYWKDGNYLGNGFRIGFVAENYLKSVMQVCPSLIKLSCFITGDMCLIDIVFILDSSESAKNQLFNLQKNFIQNLTDNIFQMKPVKSQKYNIRLASMQFSSTVSIDQPFTAWKNVQNFKEKIKTLGFIGHGTYSYYAISNATRLLETEGRKRSAKVAFLMTDGVDHPNSPNVQSIAAAARSLGIHFFTIGLSKKNVREEKLRMISGDSSSRQVLCLDDNNLIDDVASELVSNADCNLVPYVSIADFI